MNINRIIMMLAVCLFAWQPQKTFAQQAQKITLDKFLKHYKNQEVDSIYALFSSRLKIVMDLPSTKTLIGNLRNRLGEVQSSRAIHDSLGMVFEYRITFDDPVVDIALMMDGDKIDAMRKRRSDELPPSPADQDYVVTNEITKLFGTLLLPQNVHKPIVVIIFSGSGPTDRDMNQGTALKTNAFKLLSESLLDRGIATFRFDKRGVGKSMVSGEVTFNDYISDAKTIIETFKRDSRFSKVIVLGHSEGAAIALSALQNTNSNALIMVSGYAETLLQTMQKQLSAQLPETDKGKMNSIVNEMKAGKIYLDSIPKLLKPMFSLSAQKYLIENYMFNSSVQISKLNMPMLIVQGDTDMQINTKDAERLSKANPEAKLKIINKMNHVLKQSPMDRNANLKTYVDPTVPLHPQLIIEIENFLKDVK